MHHKTVMTLLAIACSATVFGSPTLADAACSYFAALEQDINQPGQRALITWEPEKNRETFTVQPKFEGNAQDFGMVIPTPSRPKLKEAPREIFKDLALFTVLEPAPCTRKFSSRARPSSARPEKSAEKKKLKVKVLEAGVVGTLDYKIIKAENAKDLYTWLQENNYAFSSGKDVLEFYVKKKWLFTVMKVDPKQMKTSSSGNYTGNISPTRFSFTSKELIYPLHITSISVKTYTKALFYVVAPRKVAIPGSKLEYAKRLKATDIKKLSEGRVAIPQSSNASHAVQYHNFKGLKGWIRGGMFLTKVSRMYHKNEMTDDLRIKYAGNNTPYTSYMDCGGAPP